MYDSIDKEVITKGEKKAHKTVILSFDDGPGRALPALLDILKKENVQAMFFWQSRLLYGERPWKRVLDEGHIIGTHSCRHPNLTNLNYDQQFKELSNSKHKIEDITDFPITYFRPPFGQYNSETIKAAQDLDLTTVMWRISSMDWELAKNPNKIVENVVSNLEDGAIILLHELKQTVQVLPTIIKDIRAQGYEFAVLP
ncbi:polysaccharide deacetylase family protein [Pseudalkalibacillus hwajinpoensis]|uniref:polysaccharide deacetylase family protein n=1 Tax=Guptibacillus hwajinpoensis TaxID=208199 RepID=UPI001F0F3AA1|nr:polysaccharide deacetylase family protein [Pseudalkalibacillus hwajinpoensis]